MSSEDSEVNGVKPERARMQFSLGSMFVLTGCVAFACAVLFALPNTVAVPLLLALTIALPAVLTTFIVYGGSYLRTFCIGALFPAVSVLYPSVWFLSYPLFTTAVNYVDWVALVAQDFGRVCRWYAGTSWVLAIVIGLICVGARWLVAGTKRSR